jgi:DNA-binding SARP family transcriptional activator
MSLGIGVREESAPIQGTDHGGASMRKPAPDHADDRAGTGSDADLLLAEALELTGDVAGAAALYERLARGARQLPPALAWRHGMALYLWGDPREALEVFARGTLAAQDTPDEALLLAWRASAHWLTGEAADCRTYAELAFRAARAAGDDRALATAHVALALCANLDGDPATLHMHYVRGLELAEAAGDCVQAARIRSNLACGLEREARYAEALEMLALAVADAEESGHAVVLARALSNEAALLHRVGRLDDAAAQYRRAIGIYQRIGCRKVAYPLNGLGDLHRQRGRFGEARAAYEEGIRAAVGDGNRQGIVPGLTGLARVIAADQPARAAELIGQAHGASGEERIEARLAAGRLRAAGLVVPVFQGADPVGPVPVEIRTLGQFAVLVGGVAVPTAAWQSRKARDLLRILVSRRGLPIARDQLIELLWGGDDAGKAGHRLAVLLSTVRGVLDPQRRAPADHFVAGNSANIALNVDRVSVDVEVLLSDARHGLRLARGGHPADALAVLAGVERAYTGEFCAGDPYDEWSAPLRDEVRATYQHVLRVLADGSRSAGELDDAVRYLMRLLATDRYDERAHRDLVAVLTDAMRHGEAHRARLRYIAAMREIGVTPAR